MNRWQQWVPQAVCLVLIAGLMFAVAWLGFDAGVDEIVLPPLGDFGDEPTSQPSSHPATAPASGPASRPASQPAVRWSPPTFEARQGDRDALVRTIRAWGLDDEDVLKVMAAVPRHEFVPKHLSDRAYENSPQPIGYGQTISQPYIVAEMTRLLALKSDSRVLEIGTGSGYQAAVLAHITPHVYTIEIIKPLADSAKKRLERLGYNVVKVRHADGYYGWPGDINFDGIIVTAAAGHIPPPLLKQLAPGGRMVIPVGRPYADQWLVLVRKLKDGTYRYRTLMGVQFVPFLREDRSGD
ncbi:MAG: protein-L-isoaspartate(D-aspartate) O-methyltransferase [Planctomycetota bacterium]|jgi:protein-L-isoaspartate(D-aspartate) O-methyltransferase